MLKSPTPRVHAHHHSVIAGVHLVLRRVGGGGQREDTQADPKMQEPAAMWLCAIEVS